MKKIGFTLGKFAPLHKGHQYMIELALQEMDEVVLMIYDTSVTDIPLTVRAGWIKTLYPQVKVIEAWDGPEGDVINREYEIREEQYILKMLNGQKITHFYSSEYYGNHVSIALGAIDRRVDDSRAIIPISATQIRENSFKYREYIDDIVYCDMITSVVFVGAMSTGKSTITEALAKKYNTTFASEYGRDYWTEHQVDRRITFEAFNEICKGHIEREKEAIKNANNYLFCDTNAITTYMYALDYHGRAPDFLYKTALENPHRYDIFFLCDDDIPYDDTWDRSGDQKRKVFHKQIIADLKIRRIPYIILRGSLEERVAKVEYVLNNFKKYSNFFGNNI